MISIYYEHPRWFEKLFLELDRRKLAYRKVKADAHSFDPGELGADETATVIFNRMSPSAYRRELGAGLQQTIHYLEHLERFGKRVINGAGSFRLEISKAQQLSLLRSLKLPFPKARVIHDASQAAAASEGLRFPVVVKPNVGGSGAGVARFNRREELEAAAAAGSLDLGLDHVGLVQEFIPARGGYITRVETLGGKYLYAIRVFLSGETFDLCPADLCQSMDGRGPQRGAAAGSACPAEAPKAGLRVEGYTAPVEVQAAVERIMAAAGIEVGGIEYIVDERDGQLYYYDINSLSNFVADAPKVVGFDPFVSLVDYLETEVARA